MAPAGLFARGARRTVFFSDASTRFGFDRWILDFLESRPTGRLLKYDPRTGETSIVLDHLALPRDEAFVVVCESTRFGCTNRRQPSRWSRQHSSRIRRFILDRPSPGAVAMAGLGLPLDLDEEGCLFIPCAPGATVSQVSEDGKIIRLLDDSEGKVINFVTSVNEYNGDLFLGSLATNFVGKLSLAQVTQEQDEVSS